ncbi:MAG: soluble NSF attachment family protein [bacterium]|nr:soluble NSF attachment family protein [bacterium]
MQNVKLAMKNYQLKSELLLLILLIAVIPVNQIIRNQRMQFIPQTAIYYETPKQLFFGLLGEFRATIADILWIKVDDYFHSAVSPEEHARIHPEHKDWKPSEQQRHHSAEAEAEFMPLIRFVTWLDPKFMMAYQVGAWWLTYKLDKPEEAITFLKEAIQHNPTRFEPYYEIGWIYERKKQNDAEAINWFKQAVRNATQPEDKVMLQAIVAALNEKLGNTTEAIRLWREIAQTGIDPQATTAKKRLQEYTKQADH